MKILNLPRQAGKTSKAVDFAIEHHLEILVFNQQEKKRLIDTYHGLQKEQVFTWDELPKRKGMKNYYGTVIDNLDHVLSNKLNSKLRMVTFTDFEEDDDD